jgi:hypothetical protein
MYWSDVRFSQDKYEDYSIVGDRPDEGGNMYL